MENGQTAILEEASTYDKSSPNTQASIDANKPLTFLEMLQSTLWALLGVQKPGNHAKDFARGNPLHFVYMGVGFTIFFVLLLTGIVQLALMAVG